MTEQAPTPDGVTAVVVLFFPDPALLAKQLDAVRPQVDRVLYVNNGVDASTRQWLTNLGADDGIAVIGDGTNVGLAAALNNGIAAANSSGSGYALLLDQDSIPDDRMVSTLCAAIKDWRSGDVAAAGPAIVDELRGEREYFTRLGLLANTRIRSAADAGADVFEVDFLITSGTLVKLAALTAAGGMDESLFIDSVDFDWSFRARSRGFALLATFDATLSHRRGDQIVRGIRVHGPTRMYYMHRNRVRLYRRSYVPLAWKVHDAGRMVVKLVLLTVLIPGRRRSLPSALRGLRDGLSRG